MKHSRMLGSVEIPAPDGVFDIEYIFGARARAARCVTAESLCRAAPIVDHAWSMRGHAETCDHLYLCFVFLLFFPAAKRVLMGVHAHGCSHARATERGLETVVRIFQPCACPEPNLGLRPK